MTTAVPERLAATKHVENRPTRNLKVKNPFVRIRFVTTNSQQGGYPVEMEITKMLAELRTERDQLDEAIAVLGRLALGQGKRRGRPPKWITVVKRRGRPPGSKTKAKAG
jgi:hypothetical protein